MAVPCSKIHQAIFFFSPLFKPDDHPGFNGSFQLLIKKSQLEFKTAWIFEI
jgi:hypothetical protein